jgi:MinD-like ATPase involved in chromosome partitioning or flagellar assembly
MPQSSESKTEIIAIASGKGGTGKTLITACLGYSLIMSGHKVLLIDADPATDGLSLFLLGPSGMGQIHQFGTINTFTGALRHFQETREIHYAPHPIHRKGTDDHGVSYEALISGRSLYGMNFTDLTTGKDLAVPDLDQTTFRVAIQTLFSNIREAKAYDYVLVDTRGGFAFESTDVCAAADSFVVVTEPDYTSFYQDRTLKERINKAAKEMDGKPLLKGIIVNKATHGEEKEFRLELEKEFSIRFNDTYPVILDIEAIKAYQIQQIPYRKAPAARFCYDTVKAFSGLLNTVTAQWNAEQVSQWNEFVDSIKKAIDVHNAEVEKQRSERESEKIESGKLRIENQSLSTQLEQVKRNYEQEMRRADEFVSEFRRHGAESIEFAAEKERWLNARKTRVYHMMALVAFICLLATIFLFMYARAQWEKDKSELLKQSADLQKQAAQLQQKRQSDSAKP